MHGDASPLVGRFPLPNATTVKCGSAAACTTLRDRHPARGRRLKHASDDDASQPCQSRRVFQLQSAWPGSSVQQWIPQYKIKTIPGADLVGYGRPEQSFNPTLVRPLLQGVLSVFPAGFCSRASCSSG